MGPFRGHASSKTAATAQTEGDGHGEKRVTFSKEFSAENEANIKKDGDRREQMRRITQTPLRTSRFGRAGMGMSVAFNSDILNVHVFRNTSYLAALVPLVACLILLIVPCFIVPAVFLERWEGLNLFAPITVDVKFLLIVSGLSTLPVLFFLKWAIADLAKSFSDSSPAGNEDDADDNGEEGGFCLQQFWRYLRPGRTSICLALAVIFRHLRTMMAVSIEKEFQEASNVLLDHAVAFSLFAGWISLLNGFHSSMYAYAERIESIATSSKKSKKWRSIMKNFSSFKELDMDKDYSIPGGHRSAAHVLADMVGIYGNIGKLLGIIILVLYFIGVDLYSNVVILGLTVLMAGIISALHINDALQNLIPLAISNAFHVGEIISVTRTGFTPGDSPETHLTGFVEGITWSHVVVRDFRKKQTFLPHQEFVNMTISNWSRRPAKLCHFIIPIVPELSGGGDRLAKLAKFVRDWIDKHPRIEQDGYKKACIKLSEEQGLLIEAIFYPEIGENVYQLRSEFIVMVMDAAKRFDLCLMRAEIRASSPWPNNQEGTEDNYACNADEADLDDLLPSPQLAVRSGYMSKNTLD